MTVKESGYFYECPVCHKEYPMNCGEHLVGSNWCEEEWVCDECFENGRENGDILYGIDEDGCDYYYWAER